MCPNTQTLLISWSVLLQVEKTSSPRLQLQKLKQVTRVGVAVGGSGEAGGGGGLLVEGGSIVSQKLSCGMPLVSSYVVLQCLNRKWKEIKTGHEAHKAFTASFHWCPPCPLPPKNCPPKEMLRIPPLSLKQPSQPPTAHWTCQNSCGDTLCLL